MSGVIKITARMILEIVGKPKEHLIETLEKISKEIGEEEGVEMQEKKIHEPEVMKDQEGLFVTFAEIEITVDNPLSLATLMFKYMPSHIEVIEPEKLNITNGGYSDILNELVRRLHGYDELARVFEIEKNILENQIKKLSDKKD